MMKAIATMLLCLVASTGNAAEQTWPLPEWKRAEPADVGMDESRLGRARDYALTGGGSGYITRHGKLVMSWGSASARYDLKSTTKSIGVTALGLAIADRKIGLDDKAVAHHPAFAIPPASNAETGWVESITIRHLATQTAGFEKPGGYTKLVFAPGTKWSYSDGGPNWLAECVTLAYGRDVDELMFDRVFTPLGIERGDLVWRKNAYRDSKIDGVMRREFGSGISANVDAMARIGYLYLRGGRWNGKQLIPREFVAAAGRTVDAVVGMPEVDPERYGNASDHYGLLWWNNADGTLDNVPRDTFWSWGLYDSLIVVIPSLDIVVARAGKSWQRKWDGHCEVLRPFLAPIVASVSEGISPADADCRRRPIGEGQLAQHAINALAQRLHFVGSNSRSTRERQEVIQTLVPLVAYGNALGGTGLPAQNQERRFERALASQCHPSLRFGRQECKQIEQGKRNQPRWVAMEGRVVFFAAATDARPPYSPSPVIKGIDWAPASTIVRRAQGSDNWPVTWGDDNHLYTAYGDGRGFEPFVEQKLSMGLARVVGGPGDFRGINLRSPSAERKGGGVSGPKVSGMLMVDGVLYMLVRNTANAQLAWSSDRGRTWTWSDWRFETSFGYPTFLNFGSNYEGARDKYVYVYSQDSDSAYRRADRMVLARVARTQIREREAFEFFEMRTADEGAVWTRDIRRRGAVFEHTGQCYRSSVSYNAPLRRYLWCQTGSGRDTRFLGGLAIYDAPQPWGPWTTAYFTQRWDVGPGETSCLPTKWMSDDGRTVHLVFSGDDCFSVRAGTLIVGRR